MTDHWTRIACGLAVMVVTFWIYQLTLIFGDSLFINVIGIIIVAYCLGYLIDKAARWLLTEKALNSIRGD